MSSDEQFPPGWYTPNDQPGIERFWDGQKWTEHTRPPGTGTTSTVVTAPSRPPFFWATLVGLGVVVAGLLGPWANALGGVVSRTGLDTDDGKVIGVLAIFVMLCALSKGYGLKFLGALFAIGIAVVGVLDIEDITNEVATTNLVDVGWGIYAVAGGGALAALSLLAWVFGSEGRAAANQQP